MREILVPGRSLLVANLSASSNNKSERGSHGADFSDAQFRRINLFFYRACIQATRIVVLGGSESFACFAECYYECYDNVSNVGVLCNIGRESRFLLAVSLVSVELL